MYRSLAQNLNGWVLAGCQSCDMFTVGLGGQLQN